MKVFALVLSIPVNWQTMPARAPNSMSRMASRVLATVIHAGSLHTDGVDMDDSSIFMMDQKSDHNPRSALRDPESPSILRYPPPGLHSAAAATTRLNTGEQSGEA